MAAKLDSYLAMDCGFDQEMMSMTIMMKGVFGKKLNETRLSMRGHSWIRARLINLHGYGMRHCSAGDLGFHLKMSVAAERGCFPATEGGFVDHESKVMKWVL